MVAIFFACFPIKKKRLIIEMCNKYNLDSSLVASIINIESRYDSYAVSKAGAMGLMQLMPSTAIECAEKLDIDIVINDLYLDYINIELGCYYLAYLLELFDNNVINALSAYNWGLNNVKSWIQEGNCDDSGTITNIPVDETKNYIVKYRINKFIYHNIFRYE